MSPAARIPRLALLTIAALTALLVAKTGRDWKMISAGTLGMIALSVALVVPTGPARYDRQMFPFLGWLGVLMLPLLIPRTDEAVTRRWLDEVLRSIVPLLSYVLAAAYLRVGDRRRLAALWGITFLVVAGYALLQRAGLDWVEEFRKFHSESRPFATFGNPDFLGTHAAMLLPLFAALAFSASASRSRGGWGGLAALALVTVWLTQSRGAALGVAAGLACTGALLPSARAVIGRHATTRHGWMAAVSAVLVLAGLAYLSRDMLMRRTDRVQLWQGTIRMISVKPLFGWGPGSFTAEYPPFAPPDFAARMKADNTFAEHPHSEYLHVAVESGVVGLGVFVWLLCAVLRPMYVRARAGVPWDAGALGGLIAVLVHISVDRSFRLASTAVPFWLLAGAALGGFGESPRTSTWPDSPRARLVLTVVAAYWIWIAASFLSPLRASLKVETEVDFLKQSSGTTSAQLLGRKDSLGGRPEYWVELGNTYAKENNFPAAVGAFQEALRLDPAAESAKNNLGNCFFMLSKFPDAERVYRNLLTTSPDHKDARFNLAMALYYQRKIKEALVEVDLILRRDPANAKALALRQQLAP